MGHHLIRATITPVIVKKIMEQYDLNEKSALDIFYTSATAASLGDDETGLYGQSPNFIFGLFAEEFEERGDGKNWR
ncbi:MAG: hypothetical protein HFE75_12980 [Firmicutes bacterium]|jgi:hypothetical protein|nr:hypothetical protein [Bacillota bacterium]NBI62695.1 hypothetical protein [Clostridiales bacterium]